MDCQLGITKILALLLPATLLLAGCAGTGGKDAPKAATDVKQEFKDLLRTRTGEYGASYKVIISGAGQRDESEVKVYVKGDKQMTETSTEVQGVKKPVKSYLLAGKYVLCEKGAEKWSCISLYTSSSLLSTPSQDIAKIEEEIDNGAVERAGSRNIAGTQAECFKVRANREGEPISEFVYTYCGADGVPLYTEGSAAGITMSQEATSYAKTVDDSVFVLPGEVMDLNRNMQEPPRTQAPPATVPAIEPTSTFSDRGGEICYENGKPVVRMFSTTWCPHCRWIKEAFDSEMKRYVAEGKVVAHHWEIDTMDDSLTPEAEKEVPAEEMAVYQRYNPDGGVPTYVFGCRYVRVGNGYERSGDLEAEKREFAAVIESIAS